MTQLNVERINSRILDTDDINNPIYATDFYKTGHFAMAPEGTEFALANFTPRHDKHLNVLPTHHDGKYVQFGLQAYLMLLTERYQRYFFDKPASKVVGRFQERVEAALFQKYNADHFYELHSLGYLPLEFRAIDEGERVEMNVPSWIAFNTKAFAHWLPTYLETDASAGTWQSMTNATIAAHYRSIAKDFFEKTGADPDLIKFMLHDFSFRGMVHYLGAAFSGMAHLASFCGTDTVISLPYAEHYYLANEKTGFVGHSVPASEHSVTCMNGRDERTTIATWLKQYPTGFLSNVNDTWDYFNTIDVILPSLKAEIMTRDGKYVSRPDSGDPVKILTGYAPDEVTIEYKDEAKGVVITRISDGKEISQAEMQGSTSTLAKHFGTTTREVGKDTYHTLDSHIGQIYGDSITPKRALDIYMRLKSKNFAADNVVFGIGSYTYQYNTRDSLGSAIKVTYCIVNGVGRNVQKDPVTDDGKKKSACGLLKVEKWIRVKYDHKETERLEGIEIDRLNWFKQRPWETYFKLVDNLEVSAEDAKAGNWDSGELKPVYRDGKFLRVHTLSDIRMRLHGWDDRFDQTVLTDLQMEKLAEIQAEIEKTQEYRKAREFSNLAVEPVPDGLNASQRVAFLAGQLDTLHKEF